MVVRLNSGGVEGVDAYPVELEVDFVRQGLPGFTMVGLAETAVREAKDRVFAALRAADFKLPPARITVNLAPADRRKAGSAYDLPLAVALLDARGFREDDFARGLVVVLWVMAGGLPLALLAAAAGAYWLAGRGLAPIHRMAEEAEAIHAGRLDARLPVANPFDEPGRLAVAFNALLARLEAAFGELGRFTADASHELRTPLTVIRSVGEVGLREPHSEAEYRNIIGTMLEEVDRLTLLTTMLLELTRAEGHPELPAAAQRFEVRTELLGPAVALGDLHAVSTGVIPGHPGRRPANGDKARIDRPARAHPGCCRLPRRAGRGGARMHRSRPAR